MAHHVIPILSSSPPPLDGDGFEWGEDDEFGGFESAPCDKTGTSPKHELSQTEVNGNSAVANGGNVNCDAKENGEKVRIPEVTLEGEVTSDVGTVTSVAAEPAETPSQESVVDSGWGSDGSPQTKSDEFNEFSSQQPGGEDESPEQPGDEDITSLQPGDEDMTSLTAMSREDSAASSLAGEFKRSGSDLVLPEISAGDGDGDDDTMAVPDEFNVQFGNPENDDEWGAFSDSVPESSPEDETPKPLPDASDSVKLSSETSDSKLSSETSDSKLCSETSDTNVYNETCTDDVGTCDETPKSSHDQNIEISVEKSIDSNEPKTIDGITDESSNTDVSPPVTSQSEAVTSECKEEGDWFADIQDDDDEPIGADVTSAGSCESNNKINQECTSNDDTETRDGETVPGKHVDDNCLTDHVDHVASDHVASDHVASDDDWDPFTEDVTDVAPVADGGWSAFSDDKAETAEPDEWAAFAQPGNEDNSFGKFDDETQGATDNENNEAAEKTEDFGNFGESSKHEEDDDEFGDFDDFGDFEEGAEFGDFEEEKLTVEVKEPAVIHEQSKPALAKLTELVSTCFSEGEISGGHAPDHAHSGSHALEQEFLPRESCLEDYLTTEEEGEHETESPAPAPVTVWSRLTDLDRTPPCMKVTYRDSAVFKQVLTVLDIDPRNILNSKKPSVPVFASNLGLLEPSKPGSEPKPSDPPPVQPAATPGGTQEGETHIPPVEFDWSGAGLTNPLDSSQSGQSLDLDFFIDTAYKPAVQTKPSGSNTEENSRSYSDQSLPETLSVFICHDVYNTALENEFLSPIDLPAKKKALTLDSILGNAIFTSVKKDKSENISEEASKVLKKLPDLSFMKAKVLMFPIRSVGEGD